MNYRHLFLLILFSLSPVFLSGQQLAINEIMSSNYDALADMDGKHKDWIELVNTSSMPLQTDGLYLSDDGDDLQQWPLPATTIPAGEYIIIFCSGKDMNGVEWHTNFSLSSKGETVYLTDTQGNLVDEFSFPAAPANQSIARFPDGSGDWYYCLDPTPGVDNSVTTTPAVPLGFSYFDPGDELKLAGGSSGQTIRYSLDGSDPGGNSTVYSSPINLSDYITSHNPLTYIETAPNWKVPSGNEYNSIVLKAGIFENGVLVGDVATHHFFPEMLRRNFPILSLTVDEDDLFATDSGIFVPGQFFNPSEPLWSGNYYQGGPAWEKDAHFTYLDEHGQLVVNQSLGIRVSGNKRRAEPQKSIRLYARDDYGMDEVHGVIFPDRPYKDFKRLNLRALSSTWTASMITDIVSHKLTEGMPFDNQAQRPAVLYINGEYWGMYFISERQDKHYFDEKHHIPEDSLEISVNTTGSMDIGSNQSFRELYDYIEANDLSNPVHYAFVKERLDIDNFIDYQISQIYLANYDWPGNNLKMYRHTNGGKWKMIFYDIDAGLWNLTYNTLGHALATHSDVWPNQASATLWFRKLMESPDFEDQFMLRFSKLLQTTFEPDRVVHIINEVYDDCKPEIERHNARWNQLEHFGAWDVSVDDMRMYARFRPCIIRENILSERNNLLYITSCGTSSFQLHNITPYPNPSSGAFQVDFESTESSEITVSIVNSLGQEVWTGQEQISYGENTIAVSASLEKGFYLLRFSDADKSFASPIIIK